MSYSQMRQDVNVINFYKNKKDGFFIEIGASDGIRLSNTYLLEKDYGWTGICVEPIPTNYNKLLTNRPKSYCCDKALFGVSGLTLDFDVSNHPVDGDLLSGISANINHHKQRVDANKTTIKVTTITLLDLLTISDAPKFIDYMSIDTEGSEYEILKAFDFSKYIFGLIDLEHNYVEPQRTMMRDLLTSNGYVFIGANIQDDCYKHSSL